MTWSDRLGQLWPQRLHHQLVLMMSGLLLVALGLLGGYTAHEQTEVTRRAAESQAATLARHVAIGSVNLILTGSLDGLEELVRHSADFDELDDLRVYTRDGQTLSHVRKGRGRAPQVVYDTPTERAVVPGDTGQASLISTADGRHLIAWHPVRVDKLIAWVRVDYDASALVETSHRIWRNTLVVSILAVSFCATLLALYLRRPMGALEHARRFAFDLIEHQGQQMPAEAGPAEIRDLRDALNQASMMLRQQMLLLEDSMSQMLQHEAQLSEQNDQLGAIFAMSPDGLVTFNRQGQVQFANQAFLLLSGLMPETVIGATEAELESALRQRQLDEDEALVLASCFGEPGGAGPLVRTIKLKGTRLRVLTVTGQQSESGTVSKVLYVCDVTQQYTLDQMKSEFLSMAAHELRTPMVSIFGFTELMLKREMSPEQRQDLLGRVYRHSQSMVSILNELLDLARIESRRGQDFKIESIDLGELVRQVVGDFKPPEGRDAPELAVPDEVMSVMVDRSKMQQALLNVLSNAYKYSPDGGPVRVRLCSEPGVGDGARVRFALQVSDEGMGLSPEHLDRLRAGERFFRADKSGNIPGTGLGVSIVKELLELMGGGMAIDSTLGQGTTVTLWL